jgi:hypothetical protein
MGAMGIAAARMAMKIARLNACKWFGKFDMLDEAPWLQFKGLAVEMPLRILTSCRPFAHRTEAECIDRPHFNYTSQVDQLRSEDANLRYGLCITLSANTTRVDVF